MADVLAETFAWAGLPAPITTLELGELGELDHRLHRRMSFYGHYFRYAKTFDRGGIEAVVGESVTRSPMGRTDLAALLGWFGDRIRADGREVFPAPTRFAFATGAAA